MQDLLVGKVGFGEDLFDLCFHLGGGGGGVGDEFDQVAGLLQDIFDFGDVGEIVFAALSGHGQLAGFLDELAGALDTLQGGDVSAVSGPNARANNMIGFCPFPVA